MTFSFTFITFIIIIVFLIIIIFTFAVYYYENEALLWDKKLIKDVFKHDKINEIK